MKDILVQYMKMHSLNAFKSFNFLGVFFWILYFRVLLVNICNLTTPYDTNQVHYGHALNTPIHYHS